MSENPVLSTCIEEFRRIKLQAERAFEQLDDADFHVRINPQQNSIAVIVKHLAGNMHSRWPGFLTTDGEKPGRDREAEFVDDHARRAEILRRWEAGWEQVFAALGALTDADLQRIVHIRTQPHTALQAITRQLTHYAVHMAQILLIAKHLRGERWRYLTIAPGGSKAYNRAKGMP